MYRYRTFPTRTKHLVLTRLISYPLEPIFCPQILEPRTILRYHQGDHRFWLRSNVTQTVVRQYLNLRYKLAPSLISAGRTVQLVGFPLVIRGDLLWPEHAPNSGSNTQYVYLNTSLVAPLGENETTRSVWIPPGEWEDAWSGSSVKGPKTIVVKQVPFSQIPMWHARGSFVVMAHGPPVLRIAEQDWSTLAVEAFPASHLASSQRLVWEPELETGATKVVCPTPTRLTLDSDMSGENVRFRIANNSTRDAGGKTRVFVVRLHLHPGQRVESATLAVERENLVGSASASMEETTISHRHVVPHRECEALRAGYFPLDGKRPACAAGAVAEFRIVAAVCGGPSRLLRIALAGSSHHQNLML